MQVEGPGDQAKPRGQAGKTLFIRKSSRDDHQEPQIPPVLTQLLRFPKDVCPIDRNFGPCYWVIPFVSANFDLRLHEAFQFVESPIIPQAFARRIAAIQWT
ncbi:hypothetical protein J2Z31_001304 [Sinorhizobium kostiense]|uniref:Uncharacterized protein n=1 Tax=Sinorhizobium kostiense TaxID=76747 RepID=A0ABS4QWF4_9HYPH|nr:hypothetical protein [Sinorhizobium kostiense]